MAEQTNVLNPDPQLKGGKKKPEEMTDHDLLVELVEAQRRTTRFQILTAVENVVLILGIVIILTVLIPKVVYTLSTFNQTMNQIQDLASDTQDTVTELSQKATTSLDNIDEMIGNVNSVVQDNTEDLSDALDHVNNIDYDNLNSAIEDLQSSAEQLRKVTDIFK